MTRDEILNVMPGLIDLIAEAVADRVAEKLVDRMPAPDDGWLNVEQAADYLSCTRDRIWDLKRQGKVRYCKDGSRLLFRRQWLDACLEMA